jgi:hypothetical protein
MIAVSIRVCASFPVFLRASTKTGKSGVCCDSPDLEKFIVFMKKRARTKELKTISRKAFTT